MCPSKHERRSTRTMSKVQDAPLKPVLRIGPEFQAELPIWTPHVPEDLSEPSETLWIPKDNHKIDATYELLGREHKHPLHSDEEVLFNLYKHDYDVQVAAKACSLNCHVDINVPDKTMTIPNTPFSWKERLHFEQGIRKLGKNFSKIRTEFLPQRTVGDLVKFYYFWKKRTMFRKKMDGIDDAISVLTGLKPPGSK